MLEFSTRQEAVKIGGTMFGGQPGENATVMCGSIFFAGHQAVVDPLEGKFDKGMARKLLHEEMLLSESFALPRAIDVIGETGTALINYLTFLLEETDCPLFVDSTNTAAMREAFRYFKNSKAMERLIYNSIDAYHQEEELAEIKSLGIKSAVVLAFTVHHARPQDKLNLLLGEGNTGLLTKVKAAGIKNILFDVGVLDLHSTAWSAISIRQIKEKLGLPCGCAPANALFKLQKANDFITSNQEAAVAAAAAAYCSTVYQGADWLFYGPINSSKWVYPAIAVADALMAYGALLKKPHSINDSHPLFRL